MSLKKLLPPLIIHREHSGYRLASSLSALGQETDFLYLSVARGPHPCSCQLLSVSHASMRADYQLQGFLGEGRLHLGPPGAEELGGSLRCWEAVAWV